MRWSRTFRWVAFALLCVVALALGYPEGTFVSRTPQDRYGWQTDAYLSGQLHLKFDPPPAMLALDNPYGTGNAPYYIRDLALYGPHYYVYNGVAPILTFFAPFHLLSGWFATEALASVVFALLFLATTMALIADARRRYAPDTPAAEIGIALLMAAWGSGVPNWLAEIGTVQLVSLSGACWQAVMLWAGFRAVHATTPRRWLGLASLAWGLSVASRPSLILSGAALAAFGWGVARRSAGPGRTTLALLPALLAPAAIIGVGLAWLNAVRFGTPFEFGLRFTLNHWGDQRQFRFFSLSYALPNLHTYLLSPVTFSSNFPYLVVGWRAPAGLLYLPYFLGALGLWCWHRTRAPQGARSLASAVSLVVLGNAGPLIFFMLSWSRYWIDILAPLTLMSTLGWLAFMSQATPAWRRYLVVAMFATAFINAAALTAVFLETLY